MADTKIEWADKVWNPIVGCTEVGTRCKNCYAKRMARRLKAMGRPEYQMVIDDHGWTGSVAIISSKLRDPYAWKKPRRVFVDSMGDWMHAAVSDYVIDRILDVMHNNSRHIFITLTGRPDRLPDVLKRKFPSGNVLIGCSISNQADADRSLPAMKAVHDQGWNTFVSYEPALETIKWEGWEFLDWMVCGGESGPNAREMSFYAPVQAHEFCLPNHISFFFKQWGDGLVKKWKNKTPHEAKLVFPELNPASYGFDLFQKKGGRILNGKEYNEFPDLSTPEKREWLNP